jgi:hypothetical protein
MAGASSSSQVGMMYVGDWSREHRVTTVMNGNQVHVCVRKSKTRKVIVGIFPTVMWAGVLLNAVDSFSNRRLDVLLKELPR